MTTRQEQVLMHLYRQYGNENEFEMPFETTQDGIAEAIGMGRAHVSIELKRLEEKGLVYHLRRHAYRDGCLNRQLRKCYKLNPTGVRMACKLLEESGEVA
jgi:DNA-binding MarR family transcriptional regulator